MLFETLITPRALNQISPPEEVIVPSIMRLPLRSVPGATVRACISVFESLSWSTNSVESAESPADNRIVFAVIAPPGFISMTSPARRVVATGGALFPIAPAIVISSAANISICPAVLILLLSISVKLREPSAPRHSPRPQPLWPAVNFMSPSPRSISALTVIA